GDGAGKTTLLRVLAGLDLGAQGRIVLPGPGGIGFVPSDGGLFPDMTVRENIEFVADAYGLAGWEGRGELLLGRAGLAS
ncbi:MAG: ATP-binding cassette domain-containing protein, partial [Actinobacteria bacterium]|nr:ATP-binding cassette domain-containing protein [Actinomycetota bacterium]NIS28995.1 ATP-binding cassette domain-containing protein [Actinomycetota bacterium]NIU17890.1 ATP-binding cassette domain-containing protein [Actinomycetota bacterium]NIU64417.1 ATP-binding cassette domain-containing protein [Actinomycetota bacterium]NIW26223.1 ATP-binding cassette domain-containing protein [Actinomycetota bacterium]